MPRFPRNYIQSSFFHIMTQGINRNYIFDKSEDIKYYIKIMYQISDEYRIKIIAYCIMNNHAHILLETESIDELSNYMHRINTKYARYYNRKYNRVGYVFRNRFKSEGIYNDEHLYNCINYIYNNPVKAKICNKPEDYPYSNYNKNKENIIKTTEIYKFIDEYDKDDFADEIINKFLMSKNLCIDDLKKNKDILKELVEILNCDYEMSLRKIAEKLGIGREKIRKIIN